MNLEPVFGAGIEVGEANTQMERSRKAVFLALAGVALVVLMTVVGDLRSTGLAAAANSASPSYGGNAMPKRADDSHDIGEADKTTPKTDKDGTVITPVGPVPKGNVHEVGPDELLRRNDDGTYTVIPKPKN